MSSLLLHWLNNTVGLSQPITGFDVDFRNGYLIGEILYRFNQQEDFHLFENGDSTQAKINNFIRLEKTITRLNIKGFDSVIAHCIVEGSEEATIDLLYKIKMQLSKIKTIVGPCSYLASHDNQEEENFLGSPNSKHSSSLKTFMLTSPDKSCTGNKKGKLTDGTFVALSNMPLRLPRPTFDYSKSKIFEKSIRTRLEGYGSVLMRRHLQKYDDEKQRQTQYATYLNQQELKRQANSIEEARERRKENRKCELQFLKDWHDKGIGIWTKHKKLVEYRTDLIHRYHERVEQMEVQKQRQILERSNNDAITGIQEFTSKLKTLEIINDEHDDNVSNCQEFRSVNENDNNEEEEVKENEEEELYKMLANDESIAKENSIDIINDGIYISEASTKTALENIINKRRKDIPEIDDGAVSAYLLELKRRKGLDQSEKNRRENRRKKFIAQQEHRWISTLIAAQKKNALKSEISRRSVNEKKVEGMITSSRTYKHIIIENNNFENLQIQHQEKRKEIKRETQVKHHQDQKYNEVMQEIQWQHIHASALSESGDASTLYEAIVVCKDILNNIFNLSCQVIDHRVYSDMLPIAEVEREFKAKIFDDFNNYKLDDYLNGSGDWQCNRCITQSTLVGDKMSSIRNIAKPPPVPEAPPDVTRYTLQLVITGAPFSGKTTIAKRIAQKHSLHVINPQSLLNERIANEDKTVLAALAKGTVNDEFLIRLIVEEIRKIGIKNDESPCEISESKTLDQLLQRLFQVWDEDASGNIDGKQMYKVVLEADRSGASNQSLMKQSEEVLSQFDFDFSGKISFHSFKRYFDFLMMGLTLEDKLSYLKNLLRITTPGNRKINGWIIDGFPENKKQARILEFALTGLDPDSLGYIPYEAVTAKTTPPNPVDPLFLTQMEASGVDLNFFFDLEEDTIFERCSEMIVCQHGDSEISTNLSMLRSGIGESIVRYRRASDEIKAWYEQFNTLRVPCLYSTESVEPQGLDGIFKLIDEGVMQLLNTKQAKKQQIKKENETKRRRKVVGSFYDSWNKIVNNEDQPVDKVEYSQNVTSTYNLRINTIEVINIVLGTNNQESCHEISKDEFIARVVSFIETKIGETGLDCSQAFDKDFEEVLELFSSFKNSTYGRVLALVQFWADYYSQTNIEDNEVVRMLTWGLCKDMLASLNTKLEQLNSEVTSEQEFVPIEIPENFEEEETVNEEYLANILYPRMKDTDNFKILQGIIEEAIEVDKASLEKSQRKKPLKNDNKIDDKTSGPIEPISQETACKYVSLIDKTDRAFVQGTMQVFEQLSHLRNDILSHWARTRSKFYNFIKRPDKKEEALKQFIENFNAFSQDIRYHPETKAELCQRCEDFASICLEEISLRHDEANACLQQIKDDGWVDYFKKAYFQNIFMLFRYETIRFKTFSKIITKIDTEEANEGVEYNRDEIAEFSNMFSEEKETLDSAREAAMSLTEGENETLSTEYRTRIEMLCDFGKRALSDLDARAERHHEKFAAWIDERIEAEYLTIEKYAQYAKNISENSKQIGS